MKKWKFLFSNTIVIGIGTVCSKAIMYLLTPLYTYYMTTEEYGTSDLVMMALNLVWPIFSLGVAEGVLRFSMSKEYDNRKLLEDSLKIIFKGFMVITLLCGMFLVFRYENKYLYIFPILFLTATVQIVFLNYCQGIGKIKQFMINNIIFAILLVVGAIGLVGKLQWGIIGYLLSYIIAYLVSVLHLIIVCDIYKMKISLVPISTSPLSKTLLQYCMPMVPTRISYWLISTSDRFMLALFIGVGVNGLYAAAYKIPTIVSTMVNVFVDSWKLSAIKEYEGENDSEFYNNIYKIYFFLNFLIGGIFILICKWIAKYMLLVDFYQGWIYIPILLIAITLGNLQSYLTSFYVASKKTKRCFSTVMWGAIINVLLNLLFIPKWGGVGAAIATALSYFLIFIIRSKDMENLVGIHPMIGRTVLLTILLSLEAAGIIFNLPYNLIINMSIIFGIVLVSYKDIKILFDFIFNK